MQLNAINFIDKTKQEKNEKNKKKLETSDDRQMGEIFECQCLSIRSIADKNKRLFYYYKLYAN